MNIKQAKNIRVESYLLKRGYKPTRKAGWNLWYISPLRAEDTPSFKVNTVLNTRFDFGESAGGDLIDLVELMQNTDTKGALRILDWGFIPSPTLQPSVVRLDPVQKKRTNWLELLETMPVRYFPLLDYLKSRRITPEVYGHFLVQVQFQTTTSWPQFALGFKNDAGCYEIRQKNLKGLVGTTKSITRINFENACKVVVFEGFFDLLAFCSRYEKVCSQYAFLVLNGVSETQKAIQAINRGKFEQVILFLDNDQAGRKASDQIRNSIISPDIRDLSSEYSGYKDYSEMWEALR